MPSHSPVDRPLPRLTRRRLGVVHIVFFTVAAAAPLTVVAGGITTTFAVTGVPAVPLSFTLLAVALALFTVGYAAMSRHVANAGAFYSYLANGLGGAAGVSGAFVALVAYNAVQISLYALFGVSFADFMTTEFGVDAPWWLWAMMMLAIISALGLMRIDLNAKVLAFLLIVECLAVVLYDIGAFNNPDGGSISFAAFDPAQLAVPGAGAVVAFGVAGFLGFESGAIYSEECKSPRRTVALATYAAVAFIGGLYAISAWAMTVNVGPANVQQASTDNGSGLVFDVLASQWGTTVAEIANILFLTSMFAAALSFHNGISRYHFALGRERVLPSVLSRVGTRSGGPVAGSLLESAFAFVVIALSAVLGLDALLELFSWTSGIAALALVALMAATSVAIIGFFRRTKSTEGVWQRVIAPALSGVVLAGIAVLIIVNFDALLGSDPSSPLRWILPGLVAVVAVAGVLWALWLRTYRSEVYASIGRGVGEPVTVDESISLPSLRG